MEKTVTPFRPRSFDKQKKVTVIGDNLPASMFQRPGDDIKKALKASVKAADYDNAANISRRTYILNAVGMFAAALTQINQVGVSLALIRENELAEDLDCYQQCGKVLVDDILAQLSLEIKPPPTPPEVA